MQWVGKKADRNRLEGMTMGPMFRALLQLKDVFLQDEGQDLVEYALVVALISFCAVASMQTLASDISNAYSSLATSFNAEM